MLNFECSSVVGNIDFLAGKLRHHHLSIAVSTSTPHARRLMSVAELLCPPRPSPDSLPYPRTATGHSRPPWSQFLALAVC